MRLKICEKLRKANLNPKYTDSYNKVLQFLQYSSDRARQTAIMVTFVSIRMHKSIHKS